MTPHEIVTIIVQAFAMGLGVGVFAHLAKGR